MKHVVLLCGGQSAEHEISLLSARNISNALDRTKYTVTIIGISKSGVWQRLPEEFLHGLPSDPTKITSFEGEEELLISTKHKGFIGAKTNETVVPDVVFPVLHGPGGEDGTVQGLLELIGTPYVGCGVLSSATAMDKVCMKALFKEAGLTITPHILWHTHALPPTWDEVQSHLGSVVFVKPANMGSSVGVYKVTSEKELANALEGARKYDRKILIEQAVEGRELECAVLGNEDLEVSTVGEVVATTFYSYDEKYVSATDAEVHIPAHVSDQELVQLQEVARRAYLSLDCRGLSRVDMFLRPDGTVCINEVNTLPGFTNISMYPKLMEQYGYSYTRLLDRLIDLACSS